MKDTCDSLETPKVTSNSNEFWSRILQVLTIKF